MRASFQRPKFESGLETADDDGYGDGGESEKSARWLLIC